MKPNLITMVGPTASGKTDLAIRLAKKLQGGDYYLKGAEIVSADSRQIYREMNIGTGKPTEEQQKQVRHYLIDIISPDQPINVATYKDLALETIKKIYDKNKIPFLVGGTGLYVKAVAENLQFPRVSPHPEIRRELEKKSIEKLFSIYKELDPEGIEIIDTKNKRRLIRAIEVCRVTGKPFSKMRGKGSPLFKNLYLGIDIPQENLEQRISKRVESMFEKGLEEEVRKLTDKYGFNISSMETIGYQEWEDYFKGVISRQQVKENIKTHTLQFAKRQKKWFKNKKKIHWIKNASKAEKLVKDFL